VAARVAAWHNQHPFAYRITPQQVHSVGYVVLPYAVADAAEAATVPKRRWQAAFVENFIAPLTPARVAAWARRHGRVLAALPTDAPVRVVSPAPTSMETHYRQVVVLSAAIDVGTLSTRVLMGAGTPGAVIGPRLWHGQRLAAGAAAAAVVMLALSWAAVVVHRAPGAAPMMAVAPLPPLKAAMAAAPASAAASTAASAPAPAVIVARPASAAAASAAASAAVRAQAAAPASAAASSAAPALVAAASQPPVQPPVDLQPQPGRVALPMLADLISDEAKAAARAHRKTLPVAQAAASTPASTRVEGAAQVAPATATAPRFALATRVLRTRAEAEQFQAAMSALLRSGTAGQQGKVQTDILPEGDDWRVVGMLFAQRDEAERTRRLLIARGMRVEVINF
jgi:hypothetical protein